MNSSLEIVKNNNGGILLKFDNFHFVKEKIIGRLHIWRCVNWRNKCKGRAQTEIKCSKHILINATDHNCTGNSKHLPKLSESKRQIVENKSQPVMKNNQTGLGNKLMQLFTERRHLQFKHPFTCMVAGPTSSGKTVLIRRIIKDYDKTIHFKNEMPQPLRVMWAYGQWQDLYNEKLTKCEVQYIDGLPSNLEIENFKPNLIIIDDLMTELGNNKSLTNLFTKGSHHMNISIIFISQNFYHKGPEMTTVKRNCHYLIFMKCPGDKSQIRTIASKMYPGNSGFLIDAYEQATQNRYGYIRVDCNPETPNEYRVQTNITPDERPENCKYSLSPIVYIP